MNDKILMERFNLLRSKHSTEDFKKALLIFNQQISLAGIGLERFNLFNRKIKLFDDEFIKKNKA